MRRVPLPLVTFLGLLSLSVGCGHRAPAARSAGTNIVALTGARLIDGTGRPPLEAAVLLIESGRVVAVGAAGQVAIPDGAKVIDLTGKTIIPGLINAHAHVNVDKASSEPARDQLAAQLRLYAQYGVTSIYSLGDDGVESVKLRDEQAAGTIDGARLFVSGPNVVAKTVEEARALVARNAAMKVDIIKTKMNGEADDMTPEVYRAVIDEAHSRGLRVAAHLFHLADAKALLDAGVDVVAHSVRDRDVDQDFVAELKRRDAGYVPTLTRDLSVFVYETTPSFFTDPFFLRHATAYRQQMDQLSDPAQQEKIRKSPGAQKIKQALAQALRNLKVLAEAGVPIAMGSDTGASLGRWRGYFEHVELELMVQGGMTPAQAITAATGDAARIMKLDDLGTLAPGKWADLVVLDADPLADIRHTRRIQAVWIAGQPIPLGSTN